MRRKQGFFIFLLLSIAGSLYGQLKPPAAQALYLQADHLFSLSNPTEKTDSQAMRLFEQVIGQLKNTPARQGDSLYFLSCFKLGNILDGKLEAQRARGYYRAAIQYLEKLSPAPDSLFFRVYVYIGAGYFYGNDFDSASHFLMKAETLLKNHFPKEDKARFYNTLGALYYSNGNFNQSRNYFSHALEMITGKDLADIDNRVAIQTNIATSYFVTGQYEKALDYYRQVMKYGISREYISLNMGRANAALGRYQEAMRCFRKVNKEQLPGVLNQMAYVQLQVNQPDSAAGLLDQLLAMRVKKASQINDLDIGINHLCRADLLSSQQQYLPALDTLQKAIVLFAEHFQNKDRFSNPTVFAGTFAYYRLFEALYKKAMIMQQFASVYNNHDYLKGSFQTFVTTIRLLDYVEKSYETDDAKMFLKKKTRDVYQQAMQVCLRLHQLFPKEDYLQQAFQIGEANKGSVMGANLLNESIKETSSGGIVLEEKVRNIKYNIGRLNIRIDQTQNSRALHEMALQKAAYEMDLAHLQRQLENGSKYYALKYNEHYPDVKQLQHSLGKQQALISFYISPDTLHAFVITGDNFSYFQVPAFTGLEKDIARWLLVLKNAEGRRSLARSNTGNQLYSRLVKPLLALAGSKEEWIIIPDGVLCFLPFESLPLQDGNTTLLEKAAISYQFSSRFVIEASPAPLLADYKVAAFAPFVHSGVAARYANGEAFAGLSALPGSGNEISDLAGKLFVDSLATKEMFLQQLNQFPVIHLATHAIGDSANAARSFIAFYPVHGHLQEDCLYLEEMYGLTINNTKLVIISACETGNGALVQNEGVMSLSRAFAYAGCASSVNSLWNADDKATAIILKAFHAYLLKGYSKAKALQQAKIDFIKENETRSNPGYWSNLVLMGSSAPVCSSQFPAPWVCVALAAVLLALAAAWLMKRKKKKSTSTQ